ncbi:MAG: OsmC family protein [bacterium]
MPVRKADAVWNGTLKEGNGTMKLQSGAYEGKYSFGSRFEEAPGTNPEELVAAAHAGCFSMALSAELEEAGHDPQEVATTADVHLEKTDEGFSVTRIVLKTKARVPGIDAGTFQEIAEGAKKGCPISRLLTGAEISLEAELVA